MNLSTISVAIQSALSTILALLQGGNMAPPQITAIINYLIGVLPYLGALGDAIAVPIKNVIAALQAQPAATADQLATLDSLNATVDADWQSALAGYIANHPAKAAPSVSTGN